MTEAGKDHLARKALAHKILEHANIDRGGVDLIFNTSIHRLTF